MKIKNIKTIRTAMPVPMPSAEERRRMMEEGLGVSPHVPHSKHTIEELPSTGKKQISEMLEQASNGFFSSLSDSDKKTVLQLPTVHQLDPDMMVEIDGQNYHITHIVESKTVGKKSEIDGRLYQKGEFYPGKIVCIKASDGEVVQFPFHGTAEKIRQPAENKQRIMQSINKEIASYNKRIENIEKASHTSRLALQIDSAEKDCQERIETLNGMITAIQAKHDSPHESQGHTDWMNRLFDDVKNRNMSMIDAFHTITYHYQNKPEQLISDIESGTLAVPEEIRTALIALATQEARNKQQKFENERQEEVKREERKQEEWTPFGGVEEHPIAEIAEHDIPGGTYKRLPSYARPENINSQTTRQLVTLNKDLQEITTTKNALAGLRQYVGSLEKGQRSNEFLSSPEGQSVISSITQHLDDIKLFVKRYKTELFEGGKINPKLMGTSGKAMGNALLAVSLNKILAVIYETIKPFTTTIQDVPRTTTPVAPPERQDVGETRTPVTSMFNLSTKSTKIGMSKSLWDSFLRNYFGKTN